MVSFTINIEITSGVGAQRNEPFKGNHEMQRWDKTLTKSNDK